jgi:hypothetical protein
LKRLEDENKAWKMINPPYDCCVALGHLILQRLWWWARVRSRANTLDMQPNDMQPNGVEKVTAGVLTTIQRPETYTGGTSGVTDQHLASVAYEGVTDDDKESSLGASGMGSGMKREETIGGFGFGQGCLPLDSCECCRRCRGEEKRQWSGVREG